MEPDSPHASEPIITAGPSPERAGAAIILVHGRGGSAQDMIGLYHELEVPNYAALAPQASGHSWYPHSFLAPLESNQPYLEAAFDRLESIVGDLLARKVAINRIALLGFSQGACLATEFAARHARSYGAIIGLTGGLIGPAGTPREYPGSFAGISVLLGAGDPDPHVPFARVQETAQVFERMGASVDLRHYPGMPHTINEDELDACRALLKRISSE